MVHFRYFCGRSMVKALLAGIIVFAVFFYIGGVFGSCTGIRWACVGEPWRLSS